MMERETEPQEPAAPTHGARVRFRKPVVVPVLHAINLLVFLGWQFSAQGNDFFLINFTVSAQHLKAGYYWTLVTAALSHYGVLHYLVNTMVLQSFGPIIEQFLGWRRFLGFYLGAAVVSSVFHCVTSVYIMDATDLPALGASGALCGVMLIFALLFPKSKILFMGIIPVPALVGVLLFVGLDIFGLIAQSQGGGFPIGHGAHLGGSVTGLVYFFMILKPKIKAAARMYA